MKDFVFKVLERPHLDSPVLVEGLPGVGNVGKLAADHLVRELKARPLGRIYSPHFPPQVLVEEDGTVRLVDNTLYYWKREGKGGDVLLLAGDYQALTPEGQYALAEGVLDTVEPLGVQTLFTLGGYGTGRVSSEPRVFGAATDRNLVEKLQELGVVFRPGEPGGGIVGASGLLLGLGGIRGMRGACLMGETSGFLVDPRSARSVLKVLSKLLEIEVDFSDLDVRAREMDRIAREIRSLEESVERGKDEDLRYIG